MNNGYLELKWFPGMYEPPRPTGWVYAHREAAAQMLGRRLKPGEHVHHEDEDRTNNDPSNLFVFATNADHVRYHRCGVMEPVGDGTWTSPGVDAEQSTPRCACGSPRGRGSKRCQSCRIKAGRTGWPSPDVLRAEVWAAPMTDVAARYGVSDKAVKKWCKALGVECPPRGYWLRSERHLC